MNYSGIIAINKNELNSEMLLKYENNILQPKYIYSILIDEPIH